MLHVNHPLAERDSIRASDLAGLTVLVKESTCIYRELWEATLCPTAKNASTSIEVGSFFVIQQMVKAEVGVGIVPIYSGLELEGSLVIRPFIDLSPILVIGIAYKDKHVLGKASLLLMDAIREVCVPSNH